MYVHRDGLVRLATVKYKEPTNSNMVWGGGKREREGGRGGEKGRRGGRGSEKGRRVGRGSEKGRRGGKERR